MTKYNSVKTIIDGITFASKAEANRYQELRLLERAGAISELELQPRYILQDAFTRKGKKVQAITYIADFRYIEKGVVITHEVKGAETEAWKIKQKMFWHRYPHLELLVLYTRTAKKGKA